MQQKELDDYGDIYRDTEHGEMYIHSPTVNDLRNDLARAGFIINSEQLRSEIANESQRVRDFSDNCRFWIVSKPMKKKLEVRS